MDDSLFDRPVSAKSSKAMGPITSENRPISVSWVIKRSEVDPAGIGLSYCPGKCVAKGRDGRCWDRSLAEDLKRIKGLGCTVVVNLLNEYELRTLKVNLNEYERTCKKLNMNLINFPIVEGAPPTNLEAFNNFLDGLMVHYQGGEGILFHCRGGVGRAGLLAACVLLKLGYCGTAKDAISHVRKVRCKGAVETRVQEAFVASYEKFLSNAAK